MIIKGLLEITIGIESLGYINLPVIYKVVIASSFLAFGGFSVHMQVMGQIANTEIKYRYFLIGRIYQLLLAIPITFLLYYFFTF